MLQGILHLLGDYILQNDWMADHKAKYSIKGYFACFIHCVLYALPFCYYYSNWACFAIFLSHFSIDKYRLAIFVIRLKNWNWEGTNFGFPDLKPAYMSVWLFIITDNTLHLICNYLAIKYL